MGNPNNIENMICVRYFKMHKHILKVYNVDYTIHQCVHVDGCSFGCWLPAAALLLRYNELKKRAGRWLSCVRKETYSLLAEFGISGLS